jgi:hypothetical protein
MKSCPHLIWRNPSMPKYSSECTGMWRFWSCGVVHEFTKMADSLWMLDYFIWWTLKKVRKYQYFCRFELENMSIYEILPAFVMSKLFSNHMGCANNLVEIRIPKKFSVCIFILISFQGLWKLFWKFKKEEDRRRLKFHTSTSKYPNFQQKSSYWNNNLRGVAFTKYIIENTWKC